MDCIDIDECYPRRRFLRLVWLGSAAGGWPAEREGGEMTSVRVGFTAKDNGFHFANRFPSRPIRQFRLGSVATLVLLPGSLLSAN